MLEEVCHIRSNGSEGGMGHGGGRPGGLCVEESSMRKREKESVKVLCIV